MHHIEAAPGEAVHYVVASIEATPLYDTQFERELVNHLGFMLLKMVCSLGTQDRRAQAKQKISLQHLYMLTSY